jgi:hypothetical protein
VDGLKAVAGFEFQEELSHHGGTEGTEQESFFTGREAAGKKACLQGLRSKGRRSMRYPQSSFVLL